MLPMLKLEQIYGFNELFLLYTVKRDSFAKIWYLLFNLSKKLSVKKKTNHPIKELCQLTLVDPIRIIIWKNSNKSAKKEEKQMVITRRYQQCWIKRIILYFPIHAYLLSHWWLYLLDLLFSILLSYDQMELSPLLLPAHAHFWPILGHSCWWLGYVKPFLYYTAVYQIPWM